MKLGRKIDEEVELWAEEKRKKKMTERDSLDNQKFEQELQKRIEKQKNIIKGEDREVELLEKCFYKLYDEIGTFLEETTQLLTEEENFRSEKTCSDQDEEEYAD